MLWQILNLFGTQDITELSEEKQSWHASRNGEASWIRCLQFTATALHMNVTTPALYALVFYKQRHTQIPKII